MESELDLERQEQESENEPELDISISQLKGLGSVSVKKLNTFGVFTLYDLCVRGSQELQEITGANKETSDSWVFKAKEMLEDKGIIRKSDMDCIELLEYQENQSRLKINVESIDNMFGGGLRPESLYEIYGEFGSGKTQFCYTLTAEVIAKGENVIWIDCEDTFKPRRLVEILIAKGYATDVESSKSMLKCVTYLYAPNTENLMGIINNMSERMLQDKPKLVVVDGSVGQFREEYLGRGTLAARQNQLARLMTHLKNISYYFVCTVLFTNQVQTDPSVMFGDPIKPIGGNVVGHASTYRLYFKKAGKKHIARMVDSAEDATQDVEFVLDSKGISESE